MATKEGLMPDGPGVMLYEVHGPTDPIDHNYRDAVYYMIRGSALVSLCGQTVRLDQGESIGCRGTEVITLDLAEPLHPGELPPLIQFIGANRIGKVPKAK
jgi:hypothetical protein